MTPLHVAIGFFALLALLLVYRYDLYNREPWTMLLLAVALGAVTMRVVEVVEAAAIAISDGDALGLAAIAALVEELARVAVVGAIAVVFPRQFDDPMDGIVYGAIVGLGMAVEESLVHIGPGDAGLWSLPVELVRLLGHLVMGGIGGFGVGIARARLAGWPRALGRSFAAAVLLHFLWDWVALSSAGGTSLSPMLTFAGVAIMTSGMLLFGALVELASRLSREQFDPGSTRTLWGWPFTR